MRVVTFVIEFSRFASGALKNSQDSTSWHLLSPFYLSSSVLSVASYFLSENPAGHPRAILHPGFIFFILSFSVSFPKKHCRKRRFETLSSFIPRACIFLFLFYLPTRPCCSSYLPNSLPAHFSRWSTIDATFSNLFLIILFKSDPSFFFCKVQETLKLFSNFSLTFILTIDISYYYEITLGQDTRQ